MQISKPRNLIDMKNKTPIVLNCFSRGGSNVLWNVFLSHPEVCSPIQETLEIFSLRFPYSRIPGFVAVILSGQWHLFDQWYLQSRKKVSPTAMRYIDRVLYRWKLKTLEDEDMRYKSEAVLYASEEVESSRLVIKNNNGLVFLTDMFTEMYPNACFFALVRHPLALYESHKRREITQNPSQFAGFYMKIAERMLLDARRFKNYHIVRFEELLSNPVGIAEDLYALTGLGIEEVDKFRFKAKAHFQPNGRHISRYEVGNHYWFDHNEVHQMLDPHINDYHMERLDGVEKDRVMTLTEPVRSRLGYT